MNAVTVYDLHILDISLGNLLFLKLSHKLVVDLYDDLINIRNYALHKLDIPLLKSLLHYCVVGVGEGLASNIKSPVKVTAVICKESYKLRDRNCGMCIIKLYSSLISEV